MVCNSLVPVPGTSDGPGSGAGLRQLVVLQGQQSWGHRNTFLMLQEVLRSWACQSGYTLPSAKKRKAE